MGETNDTGALGNDHEWRGFDINKAAAQESGIGMVDEQTDEGERQDVEEGDAPEDLLDGRGQGPSRVLGLSSSKTDKLGTGEREGSGNEDATEANEVRESSGIRPSFAALVFRVPVPLVSMRY